MTKSCVATHVFTEKLAMVGKDVEQSLCRARSRSTSVGSSPGSDLPSVAASSPDCASAVPVGLPGLLCLDPHEILPKFNLSMLEQNSILDTSAKDVKASPLRICPPPGLEDFCSSTAASTEEGDDDDSFAWVVASSAAEMALDSPTSKLRLRALESDVQHFSSLLRAPRAPVCPPPPPLQPPVFGCAKKSPQFSPPPQPPILATDGLRPVLPPPSWCPSTSATAERPRIAPPPLQPPFLTVNMNAQPPAPPPLQAPVLGAEVDTPNAETAKEDSGFSKEPLANSNAHRFNLNAKEFVPSFLRPAAVIESQVQGQQQNVRDAATTPLAATKPSVRPSLPMPSSRTELKHAVFAHFDKDHDGWLRSQELRKFAEKFGFEGRDDEWSREYQSVCDETGCRTQDGIDIIAFHRLVDDDSDNGCYCTDAELLEMLPPRTSQSVVDSEIILHMAPASQTISHVDCTRVTAKMPNIDGKSIFTLGVKSRHWHVNPAGKVCVLKEAQRELAAPLASIVEEDEDEDSDMDRDDEDDCSTASEAGSEECSMLDEASDNDEDSSPKADLRWADFDVDEDDFLPGSNVQQSTPASSWVSFSLKEAQRELAAPLAPIVEEDEDEDSDTDRDDEDSCSTGSGAASDECSMLDEALDNDEDEDEDSDTDRDDEDIENGLLDVLQELKNVRADSRQQLQVPECPRQKMPYPLTESGFLPTQLNMKSLMIQAGHAETGQWAYAMAPRPVAKFCQAPRPCDISMEPLNICVGPCGATLEVACGWPEEYWADAEHKMAAESKDVIRRRRGRSRSPAMLVPEGLQATGARGRSR